MEKYVLERNKYHHWIITDDFIEWLKINSINFSGSQELCEYLGVYKDFIRRICKQYNIQLVYTYKQNDSRYKNIYQDYDWCYQQYIIERKSHDEIAKELNVSLRVIQKWFVEIHKLHRNSIKEYLQINEIQHNLIIGSLLGDGHIDKRIDQPIFIVSHAENQKNYLYWKYDILKNLCNKEPSFIEATTRTMNNKDYLCQNQYRISTKIINALKSYREMTIKDIINQLNEFSLSIFILDDGHRHHSLWDLCVAMFSNEDKKIFKNILKERFKIDSYIQPSDDRYIDFDRINSDRLTKIILNNIPNELDIIKDKIFENKSNKESSHYQYVILNNDNKIAITTYFKNNKNFKSADYIPIRTYMIENDINCIAEQDLIHLININNN